MCVMGRQGRAVPVSRWQGSRTRPTSVKSFHHCTGAGKEWLVRASYLEIYNEDIRDLLSRNPAQTKLELKESTDRGVYVKDLMQFVVKSVQEMNNVLEVRMTGRVDRARANSQCHFEHGLGCCT